MSANIKKNDQIDLKPGDSRIGPIIMITIGLLALVASFAESSLFGLLILPMLGLFFLVWGFMSHRFGLVVPGCILTGLGTPLFLGVRTFNLDGEDLGGAIIVGLSLGFVAITLIALLMHEKRTLWPLIPAAILGTMGVALMAGGDALNLVVILGRLWPIILVVIGGYLLLKPRERTD
jgi:hypothetical protein